VIAPNLVLPFQKLSAVDQLRSANLLSRYSYCTSTLAQISAINVVKDAIREASQIYVELAQLGSEYEISMLAAA